MYEIFTDRYTPNNSISHMPESRYLRDNYEAAILTITDYFDRSAYEVNSNHLIAKILNDAHIPLEYDFERYLNIAVDRSPFIGKLHHLTSEISKGIIHKGVFYYDNDEILIYTEKYIPPTFDIGKWRTLRPVEVLKHNVSDLLMSIPNGSPTNSARGLSVISIDIVALLVMYRGYALEQISSGSPILTKRLIANNVLPNMLYSQTDLAIINRLIAKFNGTPYTNITKRLPIAHQATVTLQDHLDKGIKYTLKLIKDAPMRYPTMLKNILGIDKEDAQDALIMPDIVRTRQVWWALYLSRMNYILALIEIGGIRGKRKNKDYIADMTVNLKLIRNDNIYSSILDEDISYDVDDTINQLIRST